MGDRFGEETRWLPHATARNAPDRTCCVLFPLALRATRTVAGALPGQLLCGGNSRRCARCGRRGYSPLLRRCHGARPALDHHLPGGEHWVVHGSAGALDSAVLCADVARERDQEQLVDRRAVSAIVFEAPRLCAIATAKRVDSLGRVGTWQLLLPRRYVVAFSYIC